MIEDLGYKNKLISVHFEDEDNYWIFCSPKDLIDAYNENGVEASMIY